eukprot:8250547-Alexandrium_andersonii.AAC.1
MSASLVGSEMCIRDRPREAWCLLRLAVQQGGSPTFADSEPRGGPVGRACLLYTSDAADDM